MAMLRALVAAMAVAAIIEIAAGVNYDVGGTSGWIISTNYSQWVSGKTFRPDDTLTFKYSSSAHDVFEVNSADYSSCDSSNPIMNSTTGNTVVSLSAAGKRYFICAKPTHCTGGMKVEIDVVAAASSSPSPSGSPASPSPSSPAAPGSETPSPPAPSGANSNSLGLGLGMMMVLLAL